MSIALGMLTCLLAGCAEPTTTLLAPIGPRDVINQLKPTVAILSVTSPAPCVTKVEWEGSGVATLDHFVELGTGSLGVNVSPDKPPRSSTVQWPSGSFGGNTGRVPTGRIRATLYDRKGNVLASSDWVDAGFTCGT